MFSEYSYLRGRVHSGAHELLSDPGRESITRKAWFSSPSVDDPP